MIEYQSCDFHTHLWRLHCVDHSGLGDLEAAHFFCWEHSEGPIKSKQSSDTRTDRHLREPHKMPYSLTCKRSQMSYRSVWKRIVPSKSQKHGSWRVAHWCSTHLSVARRLHAHRTLCHKRGKHFLGIGSKCEWMIRNLYIVKLHHLDGKWVAGINEKMEKALDEAMISSILNFGRLLEEVETVRTSWRSCGLDSGSLKLSKRSSAKSMNFPATICNTSL